MEASHGRHSLTRNPLRAPSTKTTLISEHRWVFGDSGQSTRQSFLRLSGALASPGPGGSLGVCHLLPTLLQPLSPKPPCTTCSALGTVLLCLELSSPHPLNSQPLLNACQGPDTDGSTLQGLMPLIIAVWLCCRCSRLTPYPSFCSQFT